MSLDKLGAGLDSVIGSAVDKTSDYLGAAYKAANDTVSDFHKANTRKEQVPGISGGFNPNKYKIDQHAYPSDLMSEVYGGNYAVFYINVGVESRLNIKENTVELDATTEKRFRGSLVAKGLSKGQLAAANAGVQVFAGIGQGVSSKLSGGTSDANLKAEALKTTVGTAVAGTMAPDATRSQRRLKTAIALHVPNQLSVRYGMQWSEEDTANLQAMSDAVMAAVNRKGAVNKMTGVGSVAAEAGAAIALQKTPNSGAVSAALGIAANPKKEQTFKGVDFRKFTFEYQFFPRSQTEAENVMRIINEFKIHMHPEFKSDLNYVWIYPSEFDIIYYTNGVENSNIHRHTSCVLEEMNVNYTPNGTFTTFANGMPTQINMTLGFKELQVLSRETVMGGL